MMRLLPPVTMTPGRSANVALAALLTVSLGILTLWGLQAPQNSSAKQELLRLSTAEDTLAVSRHAIEREVEIYIRAISDQVDDLHDADPHGLDCIVILGCPGIPTDVVRAAAIFASSASREYPPYGANTVFVPGYELLESLHREMQLTVQRLTGAPVAVPAQAWSVASSSADMGIHCRKRPDARSLCLVINLESLARVALARFAAREPELRRHVSIADRVGHSIVSVATSDVPLVPLRFGRLATPLDDLTLAVHAEVAASGLPPWVPFVAIAALLSATLTGFAYAVSVLHRRNIDATERRLISVASVSHDLRTPISNLRLHAELIIAEAERAGEVRRRAAIIAAEADRLSACLDNIMELARPRQQRAPLLSGVDINACVEEMIARMVEHHPESNIVFEPCSNCRAVLQVDVSGVQQVVVNLLDNALKHSGSRDIRVAIELAGDELQIVVRDYGAGLPREIARNGATAYRRADNAAKRGFGLGLAASAQITTRNRGNLSFEAGDPGCRAIATFRIARKTG